ncbi:aminoglycoside 3'-phosphotransferase [Agrococcus versicolor]|uniref:Aminoglycoside 3'-phosphotransferase n=1 Tax=Agrococcus versicolor TaxID=501482 RepID=A0ABP5MJA3_9MICO
MPLASAPPPGTPVPGSVRVLADGRPTRLLWRNERGGLTVAIDGDAPVVAKWSPPGGPDLRAEASRLRWLAERHPAPRVRAWRAVADGELLVMDALSGESAVAQRWREAPEVAVRAIAEGLRRLHALPIDDCPWSWLPADRIRAARALGVAVPSGLEAAADVDHLVVGHGDACAPNTMVDADGRFLATVDVGRLGLADRWSDLAVASMSLAWNHGEGFEPLFWDAYGIEPDAERIARYRTLWDAVD